MSAIKIIQGYARKSLTTNKGSGITTIPGAMQSEAKAGEIVALLQRAGIPINQLDDFIRSEADVAKFLNIIEAASKPKVYSGQAAVDQLNKLFPKKGEVVQFPQKTSFKEQVEAMKKSGDIVNPKNLKKNDNVLKRKMFEDSNLNKTDAEIKAKFDKQNKDSVNNIKNNRKLTDEEIRDYELELGDSETWLNKGTFGEAEQALKNQKAYEAKMFAEYKSIGGSKRPDGPNASKKDSLPIRLMKNFEKELNEADLMAEGYSKDQANVLIKARQKMTSGEEINPNESLLRVKEEFADKAGVNVDDFTDIDFEIDIPDYAKGGRAGYAVGNQVMPAVDSRMNLDYNTLVDQNTAQRTTQAQNRNPVKQNFLDRMKRSFPVAETFMNVAAPAINLGRGILGLQDPIGTPSMGDRMRELEATKGPTGSIGYEDYGLPVATPGGRFTGGLPELALSNPVDFALAGSVGRYGFSPEGRTDLKYDFTPDQDTGSTGNAILDFVNQGGVKAKVSDLLTPTAAEAAETTPTPDAGTIKLPQQGEPGGLITDGGNSYKINEDGMTASLVNQKPTMADVAGPSPDAAETYSEYKARMLEALRKSHGGQKTTMTDLQSDGSYSGTSRELPQEDYYNYMLADAYGHGFNPNTGLQFGTDDRGVFTNKYKFNQEMADFKKNNPDYNFVNLASGGRAGFYTGGITDVEPSLDDIGHGADAMNARTRLMSPGNQATTSTGLNYLLAEDNDNMRIPFADGKNFEMYLREREGIEKNQNMERLYREYLEDMRRKKVNNQKQMVADGGRIGFAAGGGGRRAFLKLLATLGGGAAAFKTGILGLSEGGAKKAVTETVKQAAGSGGQVPPYFLKLVSKIKTLGDETLATKDKTNAYKYKDYTMEEDFAGNIEIIKKGIRDEPDTPEVFMSLKVDEVPLKGNKGSTKVQEYEEFTGKRDYKGDLDVESGVPDSVVMEVEAGSGNVPESFYTGINAIKKADGGRIGFSGGGMGIFRAIIAKSAAKKGLSVRDFIKATNYKGLPPEVRMYISAEEFAALKGGQKEMYDTYIDMAKSRKSFQENVESGKKTPAAPLFENLEKTMDEQSFVPKTVTSDDIAQMELMVKNRFNKGRKDNAQGGLQTMLGE